MRLQIQLSLVFQLIKRMEGMQNLRNLLKPNTTHSNTFISKSVYGIKNNTSFFQLTMKDIKKQL